MVKSNAYDFLKFDVKLYLSLAEKELKESLLTFSKLKTTMTQVILHFSKSMVNFDRFYLFDLRQKTINPLRIEQQAWNLLSPFIKQYIDEFKEFATRCETLADIDTVQLSTLIANGRYLYEAWNLTEISFYNKFGGIKRDSEWINKGENKLKDLILKLDPARAWYIQSLEAIRDEYTQTQKHNPKLDLSAIEAEIERAYVAEDKGEFTIPKKGFDILLDDIKITINTPYRHEAITFEATDGSLNGQETFWQNVSKKLDFPHKIRDSHGYELTNNHN
jgi:hypothetical protein